MTWIKTHIATHVGYLVIIAVLVLAGRLWLKEHDARLQADAAVKTAQATIDGLKQRQTATAQAAAAKVIVLQKEAAAVQTPVQAVAALMAPSPALQTEVAPLDATILPDAPDRVSVSAFPLYQALNSCKQDAVNLKACTDELSIEKQIDAQKDIQITALKKRPGFLARIGKAAKVIGCAGAGAALGAMTKEPSGAAIGAAAGAGICQAF